MFFNLCVSLYNRHYINIYIYLFIITYLHSSLSADKQLLLQRRYFRSHYLALLCLWLATSRRDVSLWHSVKRDSAAMWDMRQNHVFFFNVNCFYCDAQIKVWTWEYDLFKWATFMMNKSSRRRFVAWKMTETVKIVILLLTDSSVISLLFQLCLQG